MSDSYKYPVRILELYRLQNKIPCDTIIFVANPDNTITIYFFCDGEIIHMYKLIIADDEEKLCKLIQMLVNWKEKSIEVCGVAHDGLEALELIKEHQPDIILTDVRMPGLNGLELIEKIKENRPEISCVIISGYQEFDYIKQALQYGVEDYLLKPVRRDDINRVIDSIVKKKNLLVKEKQEKFSMLKTKEAHELKMQQLFVEYLLSDFFKEERSKEYLEHKYYCDLDGSSFSMFGVKLHLPSIWPLKDDEFNFISNWKTYFESIWKKCHSSLLYCTIDRGVLYGFVNHKEDTFKAIQNKVNTTIRNILRNSTGITELKYTVGFSAEHRTTVTFSQLGKEVRSALSARFILGNKDRSIDYKKVNGKEQINDFIGVPRQNRILSFVEKKDFEGLYLIAEIIKDTIVKQDTDNGQLIFDVWMELFRILLLGCKSVISNEEREAYMEDICFQLSNASSQKELYEKVVAIMRKTENMLNNRLEYKKHHPLKIAKNYVDKHFMDSCTLNDVSDVIGLNAAYFSNLFKKEEGIGFIEYVTSVRMQRAKELLTDREMKIIEIAQKSGYPDEKYFSRAFKKYTGLTPREYRKLYC